MQFLALVGVHKKYQTSKSSKHTTRSSPRADQPLLFDEQDVTLLLTAVVTLVATALGWTSEEAEKVVRVAMTTVTQNVTALKERKLDSSKPAIAPPQGEAPLHPQLRVLIGEPNQAELLHSGRANTGRPVLTEPKLCHPFWWQFDTCDVSQHPKPVSRSEARQAASSTHCCNIIIMAAVDG